MFFSRGLKQKEEKLNFDICFQKIKKMGAEGIYDGALFALDELMKKEEHFFNASKTGSQDVKKYTHRSEKMKKLKEKIIFEKNKHTIKTIISDIKIALLDSDVHKSVKLLYRMKKDFIDMGGQFKVFQSDYNTLLKKTNVLQEQLSTKEVYTFDDFYKKINLFLSLGKLDLVEKGIEEIQKKELKAFEEFKKQENLSKKELEKGEKLYLLKGDKIKKTSTQLLILKNKQLQKLKEQEKKEVILQIKKDLESLIKKQDFVLAKTYVEDNLKKQVDISFIRFLNLKLKEITQKLNKQAKYLEKNKNIISEARYLMKQIGEKDNMNYKNIDDTLKDNLFTYYKKIILNKYNRFLDRFRKKSYEKVVDEIRFILGNEGKINSNSLTDVNAKFHDGMTKVLEGTNIVGYDFYGKIIGADKVTGDTFAIEEKDDKIWFSLGDATGHGLRAGLTVSNYTKAFLEFSKKIDDISQFAMELNNQLKASLKSGNFITNILFQVSKKNPGSMELVGMGHEPLFIYRAETKGVEEKRLSGLAAGIRKIIKTESIKRNVLDMKNGDILIAYTDGIVEARSPNGEMYGLERLRNKFHEIALKTKNVKEIYDFLVLDLKDFTTKVNYDDDVTILLLGKNDSRDILSMNQIESIMKDINVSKNVDEKTHKSLEGKTRDEVLKELEKIRLKSELNIILTKLSDLYRNGELVKLKEESVKYIKQGYVSSKINFYLKKSIAGENAYKISIKNKKVDAKYQTLLLLYKKGNYKTVIKEAYDVVTKNGNI